MIILLRPREAGRCRRRRSETSIHPCHGCLVKLSNACERIDSNEIFHIIDGRVPRNEHDHLLLTPLPVLWAQANKPPKRTRSVLHHALHPNVRSEYLCLQALRSFAREHLRHCGRTTCHRRSDNYGLSREANRRRRDTKCLYENCKDVCARRRRPSRQYQR